MKVEINGTEYVPVTARRIVLDGVTYAELSPGPSFLIDNDNDRWEPVGTGDLWHCATSPGITDKTREQIEEHWGIVSEG